MEQSKPSGSGLPPNPGGVVASALTPASASELSPSISPKNAAVQKRPGASSTRWRSCAGAFSTTSQPETTEVRSTVLIRASNGAPAASLAPAQPSAHTLDVVQ